jgi:hypothetical protein
MALRERVRSLFPLNMATRWRYDVAPDGQRFIVGQADSGGLQNLTLLVNWAERLRN